MSMSGMRLRHRRRSSRSWWLRLTLSAFVLSTWMTVALAAGIAHADGPSSSGANSSSPSSTGAQHTGSPAAGASQGATPGSARLGQPAATAGRRDTSPAAGDSVGHSTQVATPGSARLGHPAPTGGRHDAGAAAANPVGRGNRPTHGPTAPTLGATNSIATTGTAAESPTKTAAPDPANQSTTPADAGTQVVNTTTKEPPTPANEPPIVAAAPAVPAPVVAAQPGGLSEPPALHSPKRSGPPATLTAPVAADPPPALNTSTTTRGALTLAPPPAPHGSNAAPVANVAPSKPAISSNQSGLTAPDSPRLPREITGLVSDVGVVAASAVYSAANVVAEAFGPHSFLGVPYALATAVANSAAAVGRTLIGAPVETASPGRFPVTYGVFNALAFFTPQVPPPGANDPSITVTPEHPLPIILLNGTTATQNTNWSVGAPVLANAGYKVYTFNYGNITDDPNFPIQATDDIRRSGLQLSAEVDKVLAETGAPKVILIGHSQGGGILPEYYINNLDGASKVSQVIGIAPSNHGTDLDGLVGLVRVPILGPLLIDIADMFGQALYQQAVTSPFQQVVYGKGDTRPGVLYTTIASTTDEVVTPYTQQALTGPNVTNIVLQDLYPGLPAGHVGVFVSPQVFSLVLDALASNPEANPAIDPQHAAALAA